MSASSRDTLRAAYLNTQGLRVGKSADILRVKENVTLRRQIRLSELSNPRRRRHYLTSARQTVRGQNAPEHL